MHFQDRAEAGQFLARDLVHLRDTSGLIVLARARRRPSWL